MEPVATTGNSRNTRVIKATPKKSSPPREWLSSPDKRRQAEEEERLEEEERQRKIAKRKAKSGKKSAFSSAKKAKKGSGRQSPSPDAKESSLSKAIRMQINPGGGGSQEPIGGAFYKFGPAFIPARIVDK